MDEGVEHETEIRSAGRRAPALVALLALAALVALLVQRSGGGDEDVVPPPEPPTTTPATPTSETLTTTRPPAPPDVYAVADVEAGPVPAVATLSGGTAASFVDGGFEALQAPPIATDGRIVVLVDGGRLLVGLPGRSFQALALGPVSAIVPSNEPGHVWARVAPDELALVDLDGGEPTERIPVGSDRVLGPATFGVVTVDERGSVVWRRPRFDPTPVLLPGDRSPIDAGGEVVLVEAPDASGGRTLEAYGVADGVRRQVFRLPSGEGTPQLATDGTHVVAPTPSHWAVREVQTGLDAGRLPLDVDPVWVGARRFAGARGSVILISGGLGFEPGWRVRALAEASP